MMTIRQVSDIMVQLPRLERGTSRSTINPDLNKFSGRLRDVAAKIPNARRVMPRNQPPKGTTMKNYLMTAGMIGAIFLPALAFADTRTTRAATSLPDYVEKVGCKIVDMGGYSNVQSADGGFCEGMKAWNVEAGRTFVADLDGNPGTVDPGYVRDNN